MSATHPGGGATVRSASAETTAPANDRQWILALLTLVVLSAPGVCYLRVAIDWQTRGVSPVTGDEPHYLIIADAVARDHSLRVRAAYDRDALAKKLCGPIDWQNHTLTGGRGTFSIHSVGIPIAIAAALNEWGIAGARTTLAVIAALVPFLLFAVARRGGFSTFESLALALGASLALPFLAAAGQIYPDLVSGVVFVGLAHLLYIAHDAPPGRLRLVAAAVLLGVLPWLHIKNLLPAAFLGVSMLLVELRRHRPAWRPLRLALLLVPPAVSLAVLGCYNHLAFASILGPYTEQGASGATLRQATMIFVGLHLDQAQGLFVQQPLFLLALPGLAFLLHRRPMFAWTLAATYLAVLVPNAFHPCWYGCWSISGRFMWSGAALWFFPLVCLCAELGRHARRVVVAAALGAMAWQLYWMGQWRPAGPAPMYLSFVTDLAGRNSLFAEGWRRVLPSFYDLSRYASRGANIVAVVLVILLIVIGVVCVLKRPLSPEAGARHVALPAAARWGRADSALALSLACMVCVAVAAVVAHASPPATIDLARIFSKADRRPLGAGVETFAVRNETIAGDTRAAIFAHPPARLIWVLTIPEDAVLEVALGVDERAWPVEGDGVLFRIGVGYGTREYDELLARRVDPHNAPGDRRWIPVRLDLNRYAGQTVRLTFNTNTSMPGTDDDARNDLAYWGRPEVRGY